MAVASPLVVLCALCCGQVVIGTEGPGGTVSLVQSAVRVHIADAKGNYLVDNSQLQHTGPGLQLRLSRELTDTASRDKFVKWGTVIEGVDAGDDWVKYESYYLPKQIRGVQVMTLVPSPENATKESQPAQPAQPAQPRRKGPGPRFHYSPTEVLTSGGNWVRCDVLGEGKAPDTFDITVKPKTFAEYNMTSVPASSLKKIEKIRQSIKMPTVLPKVGPSSFARQAEATVAQISMRVKDTKHDTVMDLKMYKRSPMRTMMKMACERAKISWFKCERQMNFVYNGNKIRPEEFSSDVGITNGETILMTPMV